MEIQPLTKAATTLKNADPATLRLVSDVCFVGGFSSIALSLVAWGVRRATANEGHAERLGIFVGLWAPTFFILSDRFERYARQSEEGKTSA